FTCSALTHAQCSVVDGPCDECFADAVAAANRAQVCVVVLGDCAALFGLGTSVEGCDALDLALPGRQQQLLEALLATGTTVVTVVISDRPYVLGSAADRSAASVQAFFPGEEGGPAMPGVLAGRVNRSGRLRVSIPGHRGGQA